MAGLSGSRRGALGRLPDGYTYPYSYLNCNPDCHEHTYADQDQHADV